MINGYLNKILVIIFLASLLQGCGVFKKRPVKNESTGVFENFLDNLPSSSFRANYLNQKWAVDYRSPQYSVSFQVRMSLIKDSVIYFSVSKFGFPVAKALITPEEAAYYESIGKTYYRGELKDISKMIGMDLNFNQLQALITGDSPVDITRDWKFELTGNESRPFKLIPPAYSVVKQLYFTPFFKVYSGKFEHDKQQASILYEKYTSGPEKLPESIRIDSPQINVDIKVKKSDTQKKPEIRFQIPKNYRRIELKK